MADVKDEMMEEECDIITLVDMDGNDVDFYHVATIDYKDKWYIFLQPVEPIDGIAEDDFVNHTFAFFSANTCLNKHSFSCYGCKSFILKANFHLWHKLRKFFCKSSCFKHSVTFSSIHIDRKVLI